MPCNRTKLLVCEVVRPHLAIKGARAGESVCRGRVREVAAAAPLHLRGDEKRKFVAAWGVVPRSGPCAGPAVHFQRRFAAETTPHSSSLVASEPEEPRSRHGVSSELVPGAPKFNFISHNNHSLSSPLAASWYTQSSDCSSDTKVSSLDHNGSNSFVD